MVLRNLSLGLLVGSLLLAPSVRAQSDHAAATGQTIAKVDSEALFILAAEHYQASDWRRAADCFHRFLDSNPNDTQSNQARFYLGEALIQSQQYRPAITAFQQYLAAAGPHDDGRIRATLQLGVAAFAARDWPVAEGALRKFLAQPTTQSAGDETVDSALVLSAERRLADICFETKQYAEAAELFANIAQASSNEDDRWEATYGRARALELQPASDEAEQVYLQIADEAPAPHGDRALLALGLMDFAAGEFDDAEGIFRCLADQFPESRFLAEAHYWAGRACLQRAEPVLASDTFDKAWSLIQESHSAQFRAALAYHRALALFEQQDFERAGQLLREMKTTVLAGKQGVWQLRSRELLDRIREADTRSADVRKNDAREVTAANADRSSREPNRSQTIELSQVAPSMVVANDLSERSEPEFVLSRNDERIADEHRATGQLPKAIRGYLRIAALQPGSNVASAALNSAADCYDELAQHEDAAALRRRLKRLEDREAQARQGNARIARSPEAGFY